MADERDINLVLQEDEDVTYLVRLFGYQSATFQNSCVYLWKINNEFDPVAAKDFLDLLEQYKNTK
jgi:hypothetical protein